jgi:hypothetical protein
MGKSGATNCRISQLVFVLTGIAMWMLMDVGKLHAQEDSACPYAEVILPDGSLRLAEYTFEDGTRDLALLRYGQGDILPRLMARVSHKSRGANGCAYRQLVLARGGSWGWHMLWSMADDTGLYYARMDGDAWVSSPPKKLVPAQVQQFEWQIDDERLAVRFRANGGSGWQLRTSEDEGRSWD